MNFGIKRRALYANARQGGLFKFKWGESPDPSTVLLSSSRKMKMSSWFAWWTQTVFSVISAVTLIFAQFVKSSSGTKTVSSGLLLTTIGLSLCFVNIIWTWTYGVLADSLVSNPESTSKGIRSTAKMGVIIALVGMFVTLIASEQIVGTMVAKAMSIVFSGVQGQVTASANLAGMSLQAVDVLIVQASTNTLLSHTTSLANSLFLASLPLPRRPPPPASPAVDRVMQPA